jgi:hypothetical protein
LIKESSMSEDRLSQLRAGSAADAYSGEEPPDLCPLRAVAEREELADAVSRLADACGRPLPADDPLASMTGDVARSLTEAGFGLHHCTRDHP